jgi:hypothetical protein
MSTSTPSKSSGSSPSPKTSAFGITIAAETRKAAEREGMSDSKKRMIKLVSAVVVLALISWWWNKPTIPKDSEAASNPNVAKVVEMEQKKDTTGLSAMAKSDDSMAARRAVSALAQISGPDAMQEYLRDKRPDVRYAAVSGISNGDVNQLPKLDEYLQDPASEVRIAAVRGVSNIRDFTIFDHLIPMLNDPSPSVRQSAISAIEERIGLKFPDYQADGSASGRAAAIGRIRGMIPKMKQVFDQANAFELQHQHPNGK